jgi:hypothetical protein
MRNVATLDRKLDEVLMNLGTMVLRLAHPTVTQTLRERQALTQSVKQYARCAEKSSDPRVHELRDRLEETIKPGLKLVWSRQD